MNTYAQIRYQLVVGLYNDLLSHSHSFFLFLSPKHVTYTIPPLSLSSSIHFIFSHAIAIPLYTFQFLIPFSISSFHPIFQIKSNQIKYPLTNLVATIKTLNLICDVFLQLYQRIRWLLII